MEKYNSFLSYHFTSPDKRVFVWVIFVISLIIGIGAIMQHAPYIGTGIIVVMNGAYAFGSYMNYKGIWR